MKIAILGAGAWGTAIAISVAPRHAVTLWTRSAAHFDAMRSSGINAKYLPGISLPRSLELTADGESAVRAADLLILAVPTSGLRPTLAYSRLNPGAPVVLLCKGFEPGAAKLPHEVCAEVLDPETASATLSGPSFAEEVARGLPTAVTLASRDADVARDAARALHSQAFRVYSGDDVVGVEVAGAVKNVMAIAAGICDGLGYGHNARAALITRGLAEITRFGVALGGRAETFMGLAGAGDLILTCTGDLSRNRRVGLWLAQGVTLPAILAELGHVAEGVNSARELGRVAAALGLDMPITRAVCRVLDDAAQARAAADELLQREQKRER
jgi:glycerol-3-phosphate dehydrogenase (NAD(P)+)